MVHLIWLAGLVLAILWGLGDLPETSNTPRGAVGGAVIGARLGRGKLAGHAQGALDDLRATAATTEPAKVEVYPIWDNRVIEVADTINDGAKITGIRGRLLLFVGNDGTDAKGSIVVQTFAGTKWEFDVASLKKLKKKDRIRDGYTLFLPFPDFIAKVEMVKLSVTYQPETGKAVHAGPTELVLQYERRAKAAPQPMTISDVLRLAKAGAADEIIISQMEITQTKFRPTTNEILRLVEAGVSNRVILAVQELSKQATPPFTPGAYCLSAS